MSESIEAALRGIAHRYGLTHGSVMSAMRDAYALGAERFVAAIAEECENARREKARAPTDSAWAYHDGRESACIVVAALAADQAQPETPKGGETSPRAQSVQAPYEVQAKATGSSPAVPPAPLGLEEQLRAIWSEEYDRSVSPTAVSRDEHWRMAALRRAATETPLARLGADFLEDMKAGRIDLYRSMRVARDLNLLPEPDRDTK